MTKPLQVYLEDHELESLEAWAREHGWTKSRAVRMAIRVLTRSGEQDPLMRAAGMIEGLPPDLSERVDEYLGETFLSIPEQTRLHVPSRHPDPADQCAERGRLAEHQQADPEDFGRGPDGGRGACGAYEDRQADLPRGGR